MNVSKLLLAVGLVLFASALSGCSTTTHGNHYGYRGGYYDSGPAPVVTHYATRGPVVVHHRDVHRVEVHRVQVKRQQHRQKPRAQRHRHPRKPEHVHEQHPGKRDDRRADERNRDRHAEERGGDRRERGQERHDKGPHEAAEGRSPRDERRRALQALVARSVDGDDQSEAVGGKGRRRGQAR